LVQLGRKLLLQLKFLLGAGVELVVIPVVQVLVAVVVRHMDKLTLLPPQV
jgi:hypothetical protein